MLGVQSVETTTARLMSVLKSPKDIRLILRENATKIATPSLREHLQHLLEMKKMERQDVIRRAELDSNYINQLFSGIKTKPGRDQTLALAFGFELDSDGANRLLRVAGVGALYSKNKRDAVIIHALENGKTIMQTNEVLSSMALKTLAS